MRSLLIAAALVAAAGCSSSNSTKWPELHPVKGSVKIGGQTPTGGYIIFRGEDSSNADFTVGGIVGSDGTFKLGTIHSLEKGSSQKSGAPAGSYRVLYMPAGGGDQITGSSVEPIPSIKPVTVVPGPNDIAIVLPAPKK